MADKLKLVASGAAGSCAGCFYKNGKNCMFLEVDGIGPACVETAFAGGGVRYFIYVKDTNENVETKQTAS